MKRADQDLATVPHAGYLGELHALPPAIDREAEARPSWPFYEAGLHGKIELEQQTLASEVWDFKAGVFTLRCYYLGQMIERRVRLGRDGIFETVGKGLMASPQAAFLAELERDNQQWTVLLKELSTEKNAQGYVQKLGLYRTQLQTLQRHISQQLVPESAARLRVSMGESRSLLPYHLAPSVLDVTGRRIGLHYQEAIERLADMLLAHRPPYGRTLVYMDGDCDYFAHFALQEVGRLLGIRNLHGSNAWGPQALAQAAKYQQGSDAPYLTANEAFDGPHRLFILNHWNGYLTHLPLFDKLSRTPELNAYLIVSQVSETAKALSEELGPERILLVRPGGESHLALAVAHKVLKDFPQAVDEDFIQTHCDAQSFEEFTSLARSEIFAPERVADLIVPEPHYAERLLRAIDQISEALSQSETVPIHIPDAHLPQSGGMAACGLWTNLLALTGKLGLSSDNQVLGGELRVGSRDNESLQMSSLSPDSYFGGLPLDDEGTREAEARMDLPAGAYRPLLREPVRAIQDLAQVSQASQRELILCIGSGMETRLMRDYALWNEKLIHMDATLVVLDPLPGPLLLRHAALCIPPPPEVSNHRLCLNSEWRYVNKLPRRQAPAETRSETTVLYDTMAEISRLLRSDPDFRAGHSDLNALLEDGYLQTRFEPPEWGWGGQLERLEGEVSREQLWHRIQNYLGHDKLDKALQLRAEAQDGKALSWSDALQAGSCLQGQRRRVHGADAPLFQDIHREGVSFRFFTPTDGDIKIPAGTLLNMGSSFPDGTYNQVRYAIAANSTGALLEHESLPQQRTLSISEQLAEEYGLQDGDRVLLSQDADVLSIEMPVQISKDIKGKMVYTHHYPTRDELEAQVSFPWLRFQAPVCEHSNVPLLKQTPISLQKVETPHA